MYMYIYIYTCMQLKGDKARRPDKQAVKRLLNNLNTNNYNTTTIILITNIYIYIYIYYTKLTAPTSPTCRRIFEGTGGRDTVSFQISCLFLRPRLWQFEIRDSTDK